MQEGITVAGGGQAAVPGTLPLHTGVAAAPARLPPACADKLQQKLEAAQHEVYEANVLDDLARKELERAEKQHDMDMKMYQSCSSGAMGA